MNMRSVVIFVPHQVFFRISNKENEMGGAYATYERGEKCIDGLGEKT